MPQHSRWRSNALDSSEHSKICNNQLSYNDCALHPTHRIHLCQLLSSIYRMGHHLSALVVQWQLKRLSGLWQVLQWTFYTLNSVWNGKCIGYAPPPACLLATITHILDAATPIHDVATPIHDVATPIQDVATPIQDVATPIPDVATPISATQWPYTKNVRFHVSWRSYESQLMFVSVTQIGLYGLVRPLPKIE